MIKGQSLRGKRYSTVSSLCTFQPEALTEMMENLHIAQQNVEVALAARVADSEMTPGAASSATPDVTSGATAHSKPVKEE